MIGILTSGCGATGYSRATYFNSDGEFQYASTTAGANYQLTRGLSVSFGGGEYLGLDGTDARELIEVGAHAQVGDASAFVSVDVIDPFASKPEYSVYASVEVEY